MDFFVGLVILTNQVAPPLAIENVSIIVPGQAMSAPARTVLLENGMISKVGAAGSFQIPANATRIDGKDKFLMPGLWDMHVHWYDEKALGLFTANGVVGVRQMFGTTELLDQRRRIAEGKLLGPRMVVASPVVDGAKPTWPTSIELKGPDGAKDLVAKLKKEGWDFVKVYQSLRADAYRALAQECKRQNMPFEGHVPTAINILEAARLGQRTMEHLDGVRSCCSLHEVEVRPALAKAVEAEERRKALDAANLALADKGVDTRFNTKVGMETYSKLAKTGVWHCPTLTVLRSFGNLIRPEFIADPRVKYMTQEIREMWNPKNDFRFKSRTADDWARLHLNYWRDFSTVRMLLDTGNRFLAGTDCLNPYCFPGFSLHDELALLVDAGLSPTQAIEAATLNPARYMKQEKLWGSIAEGKRADAVLLDKNPLQDIRNTTSIRAVVQGGRLFDRAELDGMLKANEQPINN